MIYSPSKGVPSNEISIFVSVAGLERLPTGGCIVVDEIEVVAPPSTGVSNSWAFTSTDNVPEFTIEIVPDQSPFANTSSLSGKVSATCVASSISTTSILDKTNSLLLSSESSSEESLVQIAVKEDPEDAVVASQYIM